MSAEALNTTRPLDVNAVRQDFPILHQTLAGGRPLVYLDTAATAQKPCVVIDKVRECFEQYNSNVHRGIHHLGDRMTTEMEDAREKVRALLGAAEVDEIVFNSGTTMAINQVALGWARKMLGPGDEILVNEMEHHANLVPWQMAAKATGASLKYLPLTADGRLDVERLDACLTRKTKLLAVTGMSNVLGTINPIELLAQRGHAVGAKILVDGAQSVPHQPVDVRRLGIDFLAFSGHKFYAPTGVGVLYAKREILEAMDPVFGGGHMIREVFHDRATWADIPAKFEAGTAPFIEIVGLGAAIDYVRNLGWDAISTWEHELSNYAHRRMAEIPDLVVHGPGVEHKGSILSFSLPDVHSHDLSDLLDRQGIAVRAGHHCTMPLHERLGLAATTRASLAFYNTRSEVDALVEGIEAARKVFQRRRPAASSPHQPLTTNP